MTWIGQRLSCTNASPLPCFAGSGRHEGGGQGEIAVMSVEDAGCDSVHSDDGDGRVTIRISSRRALDVLPTGVPLPSVLDVDI